MWYKRGFISKCVCCLFGLIFIGIFVHDYYHPYSNFFDQLSNEILSIERALEQIQTCTPDDQSRQRALLYTLHIWKQYAQQYHIQYWIAYRTLVGYVQRRGLLPHDFHIDLFIMAQDTPHLIQLSQSNFSAMYNLKVHPQWYIVEQTKRSSFHSEGIDFILPNAQFVNIKENVYINIWAMYDYNPNESRILKKNKTMITSYDRDYQWKSTPKEWTFPLQECDLGGIEVWCPAQPRKLVVDLYGNTSLNMSLVKCINGSWIKSNDLISTEQKLSTTTEVILTEASTIDSNTKTTTTDDLNNLDEIEKALEDIPTCADDDRDTQRIHLTIFQAWAKLAEIHNFQYWIGYGTLIGYVRRRGFLPHDLDVDVIVFIDDFPKLINISHLNFSSNYEIKVHPQWNIFGYENRRYSYNKGINFVAPNARFFHLETERYVDIFPAYNFDPLSSTNFTEGKQSDNITEYNADLDFISYPRSWTYPLQTCYFSGIKTLCPAKPERLIEINYGISALNQSDTKCVNGSWVKFDANEEE